MKKLCAMILSLAILCMLTACRKEPRLMHETYRGEITELGDDYVVIGCGAADQKGKFQFGEWTQPFAFNLIIGQKVIIETEYYSSDEKPYPLITISLDDQ